MKQQASEIVQILKQRGLRVTPQRFAVYANLRSRTDHPTVESLLVDINAEAPTASQATVYSALQALRDANLVREVLLEEGVVRYDANVAAHHHFRCRCCGTIEDIPWESFQDMSMGSLRSGLKPENYEVTVSGVCDRCSATSLTQA